VVENNSTGQLKQIIKREIAEHDKLISILKYDGNPFTVEEITDAVNTMWQTKRPLVTTEGVRV